MSTNGRYRDMHTQNAHFKKQKSRSILAYTMTSKWSYLHFHFSHFKSLGGREQVEKRKAHFQMLNPGHRKLQSRVSWLVELLCSGGAVFILTACLFHKALLQTLIISVNSTALPETGRTLVLLIKQLAMNQGSDLLRAKQKLK